MENLSLEELSALIDWHSKKYALGGGISPHSIDRIAEAAAAYQNKLRAIRAEKEAANAQ